MNAAAPVNDSSRQHDLILILHLHLHLHLHQHQHLILHRASHGNFMRQPWLGFRLIAKRLRPVGVDPIHTGTVVGRLKGDATTVPGHRRASRPVRRLRRPVHRPPGAGF